MFNFNKEKAANTLKHRMRVYRKSQFESLDVDYMRAVESADTTKQSEVVAQKQHLRDITNFTTESFETRTELLSLWDSGSLGEYPYIEQ